MYPERKSGRRAACAAAALSLVTPWPAQAQHAPLAAPLPEVVVTAAREPQPPQALLRPVTVIRAEDLRAAGSQSLPEVLRALGGVEITSNGGPGQPAAVRMRGAESRHTLVLIDGVRVDSATVGLTALEHLPLSQIERIEVLPGPASALYGSDAIGGVIQIFTRGLPAATGISASAGFGGYGTRQGAVSFDAAGGATRGTVTFGYHETQGFSATRPTIPFGQFHPDRDRHLNRSLSARIAHDWAPGQRLAATWFHSESVTDFDAGLVPGNDVNRQRIGALSVSSENRIGEHWTSLLRFAQGQDRIATTGAFPSRFETRQDQLTWQNAFELPLGRLLAGVDLLSQSVESSVHYAVTGRDIRGVYLGWSGALGAHAWQFNLRHDHNSQFGGHGTGQASYAWRVSPALRLRAAAGSGFRAPTFNDLWWRDAFFSGNPALRPERSRSHELGADLDFGGQRFSATLFDNRVRDLIVIDPVSFATMINLPATHTRGIELRWAARLGAVDVVAQATFQDPVDRDTDRLLPRRAREFGSVVATLPWGRWRAGFEAIASGARFDRAGEPAAHRMAGYAIVNARLSYALDRDWTIDARWNNLFDRDYELVQHYRVPRSHLFVALRYQPR